MPKYGNNNGRRIILESWKGFERKDMQEMSQEIFNDFTAEGLVFPLETKLVHKYRHYYETTEGWNVEFFNWKYKS